MVLAGLAACGGARGVDGGATIKGETYKLSPAERAGYFVPEGAMALGAKASGFLPCGASGATDELAGLSHPISYDEERKCRTAYAKTASKIREAETLARTGRPGGCIGQPLWTCIGQMARDLVVASYIHGSHDLFAPAVYDVAGKEIVPPGRYRHKFYVRVPGDKEAANVVFHLHEGTYAVRAVEVELVNRSRPSRARTEAEFDATRIYDYVAPVIADRCGVERVAFYRFLYTQLLREGEGGHSKSVRSTGVNELNSVRHPSREFCGLQWDYEEQSFSSVTVEHGSSYRGVSSLRVSEPVAPASKGGGKSSRQAR